MSNVESIEVTDELVKPDMPAILSRTHLSITLENFLLPVFEAVSNAMHGIKSHFGDRASNFGFIKIKFTNANDPHNISISVLDNGIGLDEENYNSFKTPFSGHKLKQHGRGFGRFISFKVFTNAVYQSRYKDLIEQKDRSFRFDVYRDKELLHLESIPEFPHTGLRVTFDTPLPPWHDLIRELNVSGISEAIASHFLPHFLYGWLPLITIEINNGEETNISDHFKAVFIKSDSGNIECEIDGVSEILQYSIAKVENIHSFKSHCLMFSAADRIVGSPRDLSNKIGQPYFYNSQNQKYVVLAVVSGAAFETRLNDSRTGLNITPKVIEDIVSSISSVIQQQEHFQIEKIKIEQAKNLESALQENPILKLGLRGRPLGHYVRSKPNHWKSEDFISDLAIERFRASNDLSKDIAIAAGNPENYKKKINDIAGKLDDSQKQALAEYIIHRRSIIELVEAARKFGTTGDVAPEERIHDLIFRRYSDNLTTSYFQHNLWLIDDALSFLPYVASDRTMHGSRRQKGDKIPDLAFFDESMVLGDEQGTTLVIVEFKKPNRDNYKFGDEKHDPVKQVTETLKKATAAGGVERTDGSHFSFSRVTRRFAFIIADLKGTLIDVLAEHDFKNDWNPSIYYRYRNNGEIMIQAFGYDTLLENAKKRNHAFFSILLGE